MSKAIQGIRAYACRYEQGCEVVQAANAAALQDHRLYVEGKNIFTFVSGQKGLAFRIVSHGTTSFGVPSVPCSNQMG